MLRDQLQDLEAELVQELTDIDQTWMEKAKRRRPARGAARARRRPDHPARPGLAAGHEFDRLL